MNQIPYRLIRSSRKTVAIQISPAGKVTVRAPKNMPAAAITQFVESRRGWLEKHLADRPAAQPKFTDEEIRSMKKHAGEILPELAEHFSKLVGATYGRVTVRSQHTRWGSCSSRGNLNFNCLLMQMPDAVIEYVVVHELCHRKEMNHSPRFWAEVERILPDYRQSRRWLKEHGGALIARLPDVKEE